MKSKLEAFSDLPKKGFVVAIDGPAGTGKSSVTKKVAELFQFVHVDTGALYRAIALGCVEANIEEESAIVDFAKTATLEFKRVPRKNPANRIYLNNKDVTDRIRTPEISQAASSISAIKGVREALLNIQRRLGSQGKSILEGRDIGTVIFPDADIKIFMVASLAERTKRRLAELEAIGSDAPSFEELKTQIAARDKADSTRAHAPLKQAKDAIKIDTSRLTLDQVVAKVSGLIEKKFKNSKKK